MIIVAASVLTWALVGDGQYPAAVRQELSRDEHWAAPEHWKVEVFSSVRGLLLGGKVTGERARGAVEALGQLAVSPVSVGDLLPRMWELCGHVSGYDAAYVAAAELRQAVLLTTDARLARVGGVRCEIRAV